MTHIDNMPLCADIVQISQQAKNGVSCTRYLAGLKAGALSQQSGKAINNGKCI